jgi:cell division protein FtsI (penicillin-binding protein 3)
MNKNIKNEAILNRKNKITFLFLLIFLAITLFLLSILKTITSDRRVPSNTSTIHDRSYRGSIISQDGYTLSDSQKTYQAVIRGSSIIPEKKALFVKLFSIYSGIPQKELLKKFKNSKGKEIKGNIVLSRTINARSAMQLKSLAYKLRQLDVFRSIKNRNGIEVVYGLDIIENGESRRFPVKDVLSPILGYVGDKSDGRYTRPEGKKGLERAYEKHITSKKNGYFRGKRDVVGSVIHDKNSIQRTRVDGLDLHLNIPLALQRRVELMADQMKQSIDAEEIVVGIMESQTGKLLSVATTKRYDPGRIRQQDVPALWPKFTEYPYEAGSVIKPITVAVALENKVVTPNTWFNTYNGRMKIGKRHTVTDDHKFESLDVTDIVVESSNVGTSQIAWRLTGQEFREGLLKFGIAYPSGVDLSRDLPGALKPVYKLDHKLHKANTSYGYGMMVTHAQLMKAYSAFNNNGLAMTPRIVDYLEDKKGNHYTLDPEQPNLQAVSKRTADKVKDILIQVVERGTGKKAKYPGLEVGGKTGTAHIAKNGRYVREYHSSFYGFANDSQGNKYTIGVLVIRAKKYRKYFASQSAVPTFRRTLDILVELDYLKPDGIIEVSPDIVIDLPKAKESSTPEEEMPNTQPSMPKPSSVSDLFSTTTVEKEKPNVRPAPPRTEYKKPPKEKSVNELFDELF